MIQFMVTLVISIITFMLFDHYHKIDSISYWIGVGVAAIAVIIYNLGD